MPFYKSRVQPVKMCRLNQAAGGSGRCGSGPGPGEPAAVAAGGAGAGAGGLLFTSLEQVSAHSLVFLLWQLSDLSRCAGDIFAELEGQAAALGRRAARLHGRLDALQAAAGRLDHRKVKIPVSNLDEESRWTVHYTAPWHQQENVFLPTTRPPCVEDLYQQAKLNLKSVLRECDKLRRDGYRSSQYYSQGPTFSKSSSAFDTYKDEDEESDQKCSISSSEEEKLISIRRARTPTSSDLSDINTQTNWTTSLPLPTPEEKMRQQAQTVQADVVPINVTGENFDRQASLRRSLIYTDTVVRRPKKVKRRKTITGIPDNIQKELATGTSQNDFRGHSMYVLDHYSTLGRLDNYRSVIQRSETRDSSCQTDEVKVVPPSMRRIRAQKGQGIAAQMSQFSISSGNMSVMSDSAGVVFPPRFHSDVGFHSLPRPGTRVSLQPLESPQGVVSPTEDVANILSYQIDKLHVDESLGHGRCMSKSGTLSRPKSEELRHYESEKTSPACIVSPHATYSTSLIANATISSSSEVIAIHTVQKTGQLDKITSSSYAKRMKSRDNLATSSAIKDDPQSSSGNWSEGSSARYSQTSDTIASNVAMMASLCDSDISLNTPGNKENGSQSVAYNCRNNPNFLSHSQDSDGKSESGYSGDRTHGNTESWECKALGNERASPHKPLCITPGYSTPASNMSSSSLDRASVKEDANSLYSVDHDGFYTSMHMDSGLKSRNRCNSNDGFGNPRHSVINVFDGKAQKNQGDPSQHSDKSLPRNISLKKAKKPPLPPFRTDSLRRSPKKKTQPNGQVLNETLIATLQHSLQLNLQRKDSSSPSQSPCSDYEDPWLLRSRSQSTVSTGSSMVSATAPNVYSLCVVTPSQSDTSSVKSEYGDPWGYYIDYTGVQEDQGKSSGTCPPNAVASLCDFATSHLQDGSRVPVPQVSSGVAKPKNASPEKSHRVTSPSSGYSSQSNTPTALTPVPVFLKSISPGNGKSKLKPKVPERKSSLISSVSISSSSTSLSSNNSTEGSVNLKKLDSVIGTPPVPPFSPGSSVRILDHSPLPPPPPLADALDLSTVPNSPIFPPPPPEVLTSSFLPTDPCFSPSSASFSMSDSAAPLPPPPPLSLFPSSVPPPAPPLDPKLMKEAWPSFKKSSQQDPSCAVFKQPPIKDETTKLPMPLITTKALQMVRLRPVKKPPGTSGAQPGRPAPETESQENTSVVPQGPLKPSFALKHRESMSGVDSSKANNVHVQDVLPSPVKGQHSNAAELADDLQRHGDAAHPAPCSEASFSGANTEEAGQSSGQNEESPSGLRTALLQEEPSSPKKTHGSLSSRKPPPISKKPKLFLVVPPPHIDFTAEKTTKVNESIGSPARGEVVDVNGKEEEESFAPGPGPAETDFGSLVPEGGAAGSTFVAGVDADVFMVQPDASPAQGAPKQEEPTTSHEGSKIESREESGGNVGAAPSREDGNTVGLLEADMVCTSPGLCSNLKEDGGDEVTTPSRPRTTEDLFAAIHRSKRKVLGRKDSDDDHSRNHSPSPPVTPTGAAPSLASLKQVGSIQRSIRKSSTSSDNFKALLLKKGSRADTSSRMSAAEMLKNTDPRFHRSRSEPSSDVPDSPSSCSPNKNRRAQEEWAKNEGLMPRSLSFSGTRYGRSRTPPSAASSRYSMRNRIQSSPMTVISEGEGEAMEPTENRIHRTSGVGREKEMDRFTGNEMDTSELPYSEENGSKGAQAPSHLDAMDKEVSKTLSGQRRSSLREES